MSLRGAPSDELFDRGVVLSRESSKDLSSPGRGDNARGVPPGGRGDLGEGGRGEPADGGRGEPAEGGRGEFTGDGGRGERGDFSGGGAVCNETSTVGSDGVACTRTRVSRRVSRFRGAIPEKSSSRRYLRR